MSKEVEVQGLSMTAATPEDIQISVGKITQNKKLNDSDSFLVENGGELAPDAAIMWSNILDISQYYKMGRIIPASSTTGENIYFTPDATAIGQTVSGTARYYAATDGLTAIADSTINGGIGDSLMATLHPNTASDAWTGNRAVAYNNTQDDGYYVDVPLWLRTSSDDNVALKVQAFVINATNNKLEEADIELYKAARVVILDPTGGAGDTLSTSKIIDLKAGSYSGASVIDYYGDKINTEGGKAVSNGAVNMAGTLGTNDIYATYQGYDGTGSVCTVAGSNTAEYGTPKKVYARIWLEGEDKECWNQNAGQDFKINLKFTKIETT